MLKYVPNTLTIIRFLLIPVILYSIIREEYLTALILFTISSATDVADGFIARKFNLISNFGKLMDPLADKLTLISLLVTLAFKGIIPIWILVIVALKEVTMVVGASFLYGKDVVVYSRWYGKLATVLFFLAIASSLLIKELNITNWIADVDLALYCLALIATIFAFVMYIKTLLSKGFIDKSDLHKDVTVEKKERKKKRPIGRFYSKSSNSLFKLSFPYTISPFSISIISISVKYSVAISVSSNKVSSPSSSN